MTQAKSILNTVLTRVSKTPSKPSKTQKNDSDTPQMTMDTYMKAINPYGNPIKIFKPVVDILIHSRPTTRIVMGFLFENLKQGSHLVELEWQEFVRKGYGSRDTFYRGIVDLKDKKMIQKKSGQIYEINPDFVFKGDIARFLTEAAEAKHKTA